MKREVDMTRSDCDNIKYLNTNINSPVSVTENSIVFNPREMELNKYYLAELNGAPYLYRRVSSEEVEVYGLAD